MQVRKIKFHHQEQVDEIVEQIEDQTYYLVPDAHFGLRSYFEKKHRYAELNRVSQKMFDRADKVRPSQFTQQHQRLLKNVIPSDLCQVFIEQAAKSKEAIYHPDFMNSLLPIILNQEIDQELCSYFNSEYTLLWYSYLETEADLEKRAYSSYWHCDGGPEQHVKILIYLDGYQQHLGNTKFLDKATTDQLKKVGYIFGNIETRAEDIMPLCRAKGITLDEIMYENIEAGDALLFNPNQIAHIGKIPELGTRHVLQLCFIPSPYHWQFTKTNVLHSQTKCIEFEGCADKILNFVDRKPGQMASRVMITADNQIKSPEHLKWLLENIYADENFSALMFERLMVADPELQQITNLEELLLILKQSFKESINWQGQLGLENIQHLQQLALFEQQLHNSCSRYDKAGKANPAGIFWPSPDHPTHPSSKFQALPFVNKHPIMDINTPIGSAGSCFAFEIARVFQQTGFNYVITERNDDPASGLVVDGYQAGDKYAKFCANYGILFNTPSFRQLAERAFDITPTQQILFQQADGGWVDPYRENVMFFSHEAYINDYERHIAATRSALEQVEVFIITLGLNECWQFRDGSVMSRNPRDNMYPFVTHKTLTVQENIDNIQAFYDIVKQHNPTLKLIISVSPIPFLATGRADEQHVISANCHSKAVLRVAADELVQRNPDIYYLPSYELVTECLEDAWLEDQRHVKASTVERVVEMFKQIFVKTSETK